MTEVEYDDSLIRRMSSAMNGANAFEVESVMRSYLSVLPRRRLEQEETIIISVYAAVLIANGFRQCRIHLGVGNSRFDVVVYEDFGKRPRVVFDIRAAKTPESLDSTADATMTALEHKIRSNMSYGKVVAFAVSFHGRSLRVLGRTVSADTPPPREPKPSSI